MNTPIIIPTSQLPEVASCGKENTCLYQDRDKQYFTSILLKEWVFFFFFLIKSECYLFIKRKKEWVLFLLLRGILSNKSERVSPKSVRTLMSYDDM